MAELDIKELTRHQKLSKGISIDARITEIEQAIIQAVSVGADYYCLPYTLDLRVAEYLLRKGYKLSEFKVGIAFFTKIYGW